MYPYDFKPKYSGINHREIFVVMPFSNEFDPVFESLIQPATIEANKILEKNDTNIALQPFRTKDDISTTSGWMNVLEHLVTAQIIIGVLTSNNANVFYELGIAHATQPITRQILIADNGYKRPFDTKDLIYFEYNQGKLSDGIIPLSEKIAEAIKLYKIEDELKIYQARMTLGPYEFDVVAKYGQQNNFHLHVHNEKEVLEHENKYGTGSYERYAIGMSNLCVRGLVGLNTKTDRNDDGSKLIESSYYWTNLGNDLLLMMKIIDEDEVKERRQQAPFGFI